MKIEFKTDKVEYLFKAGNDFVRGEMPKADAEKIIAENKPEEASQNGFNVKAGNYYFKSGIKKAAKSAKKKDDN